MGPRWLQDGGWSPERQILWLKGWNIGRAQQHLGGERSWVSNAVTSDLIHPVYVMKLIYNLWTVELSRASQMGTYWGAGDGAPISMRRGHGNPASPPIPHLALYTPFLWLFPGYILLYFIELWLIYNVVCLISAVQQRDSVVPMYILFHVLFHYGLSQEIEYGSLCSTVGPCYLFILYVIVCIC